MSKSGSEASGYGYEEEETSQRQSLHIPEHLREQWEERQAEYEEEMNYLTRRGNNNTRERDPMRKARREIQ